LHSISSTILTPQRAIVEVAICEFNVDSPQGAMYADEAEVIAVAHEPRGWTRATHRSVTGGLTH
jgi:hypothetical protein